MDIWGLVRTTFFFKHLVDLKRIKAFKFFPWRKKPSRRFRRSEKIKINDKYFLFKKQPRELSLGRRRFFKINVNARLWRNLKFLRLRSYIFAFLQKKLKHFFFFVTILKFLRLCIFNFIYKELLFFLPLLLLKNFVYFCLLFWKKLKTKVINKFYRIYFYKKSLFYKLSKYFLNTDININSIYENNKLQNLFEFFFFLSKKYKERRYQKYQRYVYRIDIIDPKKKIKRKPYHFVALRLVKLYYLIYHYRQFNRLAKRLRKLDGLFEHNFCIALEGRLITALYRTGLVAHIFECIDLVNSGYFLINQSVIGHLHCTVRLGDLMGFAYEYKWLLYYRLLWRLLRKAISFNPPKYLFVSYPLLLAFMLKLPSESDLVFPSSVDMFRATGYFR